MKNENPFVVVPEDHISQITDLLDHIAKEREEIVNILSKSQGLDIDSLQKAVASQSETIANRLLENMAPPAAVENLQDHSPWKKFFFQGAVVGIIGMLVLTMAIAVLSLKNLNSLDRHWQNLIREKMQTATEIEQSIDFFKGVKEVEDAGQSD